MPTAEFTAAPTEGPTPAPAEQGRGTPPDATRPHRRAAPHGVPHATTPAANSGALAHRAGHQYLPSLGTALSGARPEEGGLASGIVNTGYQVGSALCLAAMTALAAAHGAREPGNPTALTNGFSAAFLGAAVLAAVGALTALLTLRTTPSADEAARGEQQEKATA
ncbi:hypothetical protein ACF1BU_12140 [Streptomyces sp. NPDC014724]|uniref:hypothetical protein n=1 Tax=unclassified Streptomyces TaxID=2593676 RepID=UPI0036FEFA9C